MTSAAKLHEFCPQYNCHYMHHIKYIHLDNGERRLKGTIMFASAKNSPLGSIYTYIYSFSVKEPRRLVEVAARRLYTNEYGNNTRSAATRPSASEGVAAQFRLAEMSH